MMEYPFLLLLHPLNVCPVSIRRIAGDKDFRKHMPKLLRDLAPSSAFDPRNAWVAEQERMAKSNEPQSTKGKEDDGKQVRWGSAMFVCIGGQT